jgi:phosphatidylserine/phosphatidylglycerophosphate/cardiolipin synthase-like enzyme
MSLLHDCRPDKSDDHFQRGIVRMMDHAKCSLLIETPYPAFDPKIRAAISRASRRGVQVTILTNSLNSIDHVSVYAAYQNQKRSLLREGVQLREYCGRHTLHAKTMIIDDSSWMLGSYNFDARSDNLNLELCIVSCDPAGAAALRGNVQKRLAKSTLIASDKILLPVGQNATLLKRARMAILRTVVELYRGLL